MHPSHANIESALSAAFPAKVEEPLPATVGRFQIIERIGRGGTGLVYAATDPLLQRTVALKVLRSEVALDPRMRQLFDSEASITSRLQHPGIMPVHEAGIDVAGRGYIVMKLVRGESMSQRMKARKHPEEKRGELLAIFQRICETVAYAHNLGVVHGDMKPQNVLLGEFGEVLVTDWGFARILANARLSGATPLASSVVAGTPAYMAPEQANGQQDAIDQRTDVFTLGATLCQILTGLPPYAGDENSARRAAQLGALDDAHRRLDEVRTDTELVALTRECLQMNRDLRPKDASVLASRLARHAASIAERIQQRDLEAAEARVRAAAAKRQRRATVLTAIAICSTLIVAALAWYWNSAEEAQRVIEADKSLRASMGRAALLAEDAAAVQPPDPNAWERVQEHVSTAAALVEGLRPSAGALEELRQLQDQVASGHKDSVRLAAVATALDAFIDHVEDYGDSERRGRQMIGLFKSAGIDLCAENAAAVTALIAASPLREALVHTLDSWKAGAAWTFLKLAASPADLASAVDPDPYRVKLRAAAWHEGKAVLLALAEAGEWKHQGAATMTLLANYLLMHGERNTARAVLTEARVRHPDNYAAIHLLGSILRGGDAATQQEMVRCFSVAMALRPRSSHAVADLMTALVACGNTDEALRVADEALRVNPSEALLLHQKALVLRARKDPVAALDYAQRAVAADPSSVASREVLLQVRAGQASLGVLLPEVRLAVADFPNSVALRVLLLSALLETRQLQLALDLGRELSRTNPSNADIHYLLGTVELNLRSPDAVEHLRKATVLRPESARSWCNLGHALREAGEFLESLSALRRGNDLGQHSEGWQYPSGEWVVFAEQAAHFDALIREGAPVPEADTVEAASTLSFVARARGRHDIAAACFERMFELDPSYLDAPPTRMVYDALRAHMLARCQQAGLDAGVSKHHGQRALHWMQREADAIERLARSNPAVALAACNTALEDSALAPVRDEPISDRLDEPERAAWKAHFERLRLLASRH